MLTYFCLVLLCVRVLGGKISTQDANITSSNDEHTCETLYLLHIAPYPDSAKSAGWDRGFELIPAGHLATRHINNDPNILQGYNLEIISVESESCARRLIIKGLLNYYMQSLDPESSKCVYGVVGLYCSAVTNTIAPIVNHPNIGYVQYWQLQPLLFTGMPKPFLTLFIQYRHPGSSKMH